MPILLAGLLIALAGTSASSARDASPLVRIDPEDHLQAGDLSRTLERGDRIRWRDRSGQRLVGELIESDLTALVVRVADRPEPMLVSRVTLRDLERSIGRRRSGGKGARIGFLTAGAVGALLGAVCLDPGGGCGSSAGAFGGAMILGGVGAAVGGLVGLGVKSEHWERADEASLQLTVTPVRAGVAAGLAVRWR